MLERLQRDLDSFSRAERRVAEWILAQPKRASRATLAELARACGTSQPTVIRFCRHLGLGGFRDLALALTEALSKPAIYVHRDVHPHDEPTEAVTKVVDASIQTLIDLRAQLAEMPVEAAVRAMTTARQIAFAGLGASGHVAADGCHKFFRLGVPCTALTDSPSILQFAAVADPRDVLVIISHTGRWPELGRAASAALERGACVVALTDPRSPLAACADILFACRVPEDTSIYTPMHSRLAQLALLDALQVALALALGEPAMDRLRRAKSALRQPAVAESSPQDSASR